MAAKHWTPRSKGEERVNKALQLLGRYDIQHEYQIGQRLRLDFYIRELRLAIEVQGDQHSSPNAFFYSDADARKAAVKRDEVKAQLCAEAGITLICLDYPTIMASKSADDLKQLILSKYTKAQSGTTTRVNEQEDW